MEWPGLQDVNQHGERKALKVGLRVMVLTFGSDGFLITGDAWGWLSSWEVHGQCLVMHGRAWVRGVRSATG